MTFGCKSANLPDALTVGVKLILIVALLHLRPITPTEKGKNINSAIP